MDEDLPSGPPPLYEECVSTNNHPDCHSNHNICIDEGDEVKDTISVPLMATDHDSSTSPVLTDSKQGYGACSRSEAGSTGLVSAQDHSSMTTQYQVNSNEDMDKMSEQPLISATGPALMERPSIERRRSITLAYADGEEEVDYQAEITVENGIRVNRIHFSRFPTSSFLTTKGMVECPNLVESSPPGKCSKRHLYVFLVVLICYGGLLMCSVTLAVGLTGGPLPGQRDLSIVMAGIFLGFCYLGILFEALLSDTAIYLTNIWKEDDTRNHIDKMSKALPEMIFSVRSFYPVRRNIVTVVRTEEFTEYQDCYSITGQVEDIPPGILIRVEFDNIIGFMDEGSKDYHDNCLLRYDERYKNIDCRMAVKESIRIPDFITRASLCRGSTEGLGFMQWKYFMIASLFLLSWPYRWWLRSRTVKVRFTFVKLLKCGPSSSENH